MFDYRNAIGLKVHNLNINYAFVEFADVRICRLPHLPKFFDILGKSCNTEYYFYL